MNRYLRARQRRKSKPRPKGRVARGFRSCVNAVFYCIWSNKQPENEDLDEECYTQKDTSQQEKNGDLSRSSEKFLFEAGSAVPDCEYSSSVGSSNMDNKYQSQEGDVEHNREDSISMEGSSGMRRSLSIVNQPSSTELSHVPINHVPINHVPINHVPINHVPINIKDVDDSNDDELSEVSISSSVGDVAVSSSIDSRFVDTEEHLDDGTVPLASVDMMGAIRPNPVDNESAEMHQYDDNDHRTDVEEGNNEQRRNQNQDTGHACAADPRIMNEYINSESRLNQPRLMAIIAWYLSGELERHDFALPWKLSDVEKKGVGNHGLPGSSPQSGIAASYAPCEQENTDMDHVAANNREARSCRGRIGQPLMSSQGV